MSNYIWAIAASVFISCISLIGIFSILLKDKLLEKLLISLIGFSAGGLMGGAFLHIMPEAVEEYGPHSVFLYLILGFILFFILEKYLHWRHCHKGGQCEIHPFTYLNLIGDAVHNFADGLVIGASFLVSIHFGIVTTIIVSLHEIPQEIGDFGVLVYGGFSRAKALLCNFLTALTCVLGAAIGYPLSQNIKGFSMFLLPIVAGGFVYIAACDLIPEMRKQGNSRQGVFSFIAFLLGITFIFLFGKVLPH
jgi:zinc and cadmium transporter